MRLINKWTKKYQDHEHFENSEFHEDRFSTTCRHGPSTYTNFADFQARTASVAKLLRCLNVLRERASPTKTGGSIDIIHTSVVGEGAKGKPRGYDEKLSGLVGDDFCFGDGMRDCALYFSRTFCCQRAGLLFYLRSQSPSDWYCRSLLIHMRSRLLQLEDTSTGVCSIKFRTKLGGFWNRAS